MSTGTNHNTGVYTEKFPFWRSRYWVQNEVDKIKRDDEIAYIVYSERLKSWFYYFLKKDRND